VAIFLTAILATTLLHLHQLGDILGKIEANNYEMR
jgi:hypothetical protein